MVITLISKRGTKPEAWSWATYEDGLAPMPTRDDPGALWMLMTSVGGVEPCMISAYTTIALKWLGGWIKICLHVSLEKVRGCGNCDYDLDSNIG